MKRGNLEVFIDKAIPYLVVILAVLIILENPFWQIIHLENYEPYVGIVDGFIVLFFIVDLYFKWNYVKNFKKFVKLYWLDIIAVFPFYLLARTWLAVAAFIRFSEEVGGGQKFLHEFLLLRETELVKEAKLSREIKPLLRTLKTIQRFIRFVAGKRDKH